MVLKCRDNWLQRFLLIFVAFLILFFPSITMIFLGQSSFSVGIVIASVCSIALFFFRLLLSGHLIVNKKYILGLLLLLGCGFFVFVHIFYVISNLPILLEIDSGRFFLSFLCLVLVFFSAFLSALYLKFHVRSELILNVINVCAIILLLNGLISLTRIDFFSSGLPKPTFIFLEPSHFALVVTPFLLYFCLTLSRIKALCLLILAVCWASYIQNLTLLFGVVLAFLVSTRQNLLTAGSFFFIFIFILVSVFGADNFSYFTDRLSLSGDNDNLSVLVLFQGWQNAIETLTTQSYFGGGFQQFGITTVYGSISSNLYMLLGVNINQFDAGATAPKIIGEFGVFGILFLFVCLFFYLKVFIFLRKIRSKNISRVDVFFYAIFISSSLELFIRGVGYFSPLMYLSIISVFYFLIKNKNIRLELNEINR